MSQKTSGIKKGGITPTRRFAQNAIILIIVNLLMRTVGVSFNIYISNRAGSQVMGLFSLLSGVYSLALTLGSGAVSLGTTRLVADTIGKHSTSASPFEMSDACKSEVRRVVRRCMVYALILSSLTGIIMFSLSDIIGKVWLGDERTISSLRILSITLPPIALSSCLSGYFTAVRRVSRNAAMSIIGQLTRLGFCSYLLTLWLSDGIEGPCMALVLGGALSEAIGAVLSWLAYLFDKHKYLSGKNTDASTDKGLTGRLLSITVPVTLSACIRSGLITLEHILIPKGLKKSGASWESALSSYGILHSMVLPVVLFPSAFISSFSSLLVPEIAESKARGDLVRVARISEKIITPALVFSFGVSGIMIFFSHELGMMIYNSPEAGLYIRQLAPLIPIMYVDSSVDAVLKGMGEQVYSMNVNITDALMSVILVWLLLPKFGLFGYVITIYFTETLNTVLSLARMLRISRMRVRLWKQVFGPLISVVGVCCAVKLIWGYISNALRFSGGNFEIIACITVTALMYFGTLILVGVIDKKDAKTVRSIIK